MLVGLDFDNTLISYDELFRAVALDRALIPEEIPPSKNAVRDFLRETEREDEWTRLQGEVYGIRILEAKPFPSVEAALDSLIARRIPYCIVSHKTKTPYLGDPVDLHAAARAWLAKYRVADSRAPHHAAPAVFFELSKEQKLARIQALGCTHFIDDLPEILTQLPSTIERILFAPDCAVKPPPGCRVLRSWSELQVVLGLGD